MCLLYVVLQAAAFYKVGKQSPAGNFAIYDVEPKMFSHTASWLLRCRDCVGNAALLASFLLHFFFFTLVYEKVNRTWHKSR